MPWLEQQLGTSLSSLPASRESLAGCGLGGGSGGGSSHLSICRCFLPSLLTKVDLCRPNFGSVFPFVSAPSIVQFLRSLSCIPAEFP
ncbi:hypothetical protein E2C01_082784 [Portunus trituberculatus]|uniref:Uncharacterized protein n=1 Tax=Portunus trituberculatus TaxID=210409 RepID=A0A5B7J624_PORTR|nr:hypothetical protein [Portunus trituberculatus]